MTLIDNRYISMTQRRATLVARTIDENKLEVQSNVK